MDNYGLFDAKDEALAERRLEMAQRFRGLQRRIERVRATALPL
jgi:hypothetical protein